MDLKSYLALVPTKKDLFHDIELQGTSDEVQMLEDFCNIKAKRKRIHAAWDFIISSIIDKFYMFEYLDFLTEKTISYLVENKIALITLGHLRLSDEWLLKIYEKDNLCTEAIQTVELRKQKNKL